MRSGVLFLLVAACGGAGTDVPPAENNAAQPESTDSRAERNSPEDDGLEVEGLTGTLSPDEIHSALNPRLPEFARCFSRRYRQLELVAGHFEFAFGVNPRGRVATVVPASSSVGDRPTERCLLEVAADTRFPEPHGGAAEFSWSVSFDPPEDVRPATVWPPSHVSEAVDEQSDSLRECSRRGFDVTMYVAPGGAVMAAGATGDDPSEETLDCVASAVSEWQMPDPGSYPAKVSFRVR